VTWLTHVVTLLVGVFIPVWLWGCARLFVLWEERRDAIHELRQDLEAWGKP
jgi:hypothetical protein